MSYKNKQIADTAQVLKSEFDSIKDKPAIMRSTTLKALFDAIKTLPPEERAAYGKEVNELRQELQRWIDGTVAADNTIEALDVTAPYDANTPLEKRPRHLPSEFGSIHPLMDELDHILDIFYRMGFEAVEAREIDDDYHMFGSLNFPEGHPARDDFDTFMTTEKAADGKPLVAPAHTSTMQNRVLKAGKSKLENGEPIAVVVPGRVFRNEDVDARHEHTFYQLEGVYVGKSITVGNLMAVLKTFMTEYYQKDIELKTQPFYFPFTEPSFEFAISCPFCNKEGCHVCGEGWIELLGCGMIHPNVLKEAGIDPTKYTGFAWGVGFMRMAMIKYGIDDIRLFQSGKLEFLRQFS
ncbi:MAG: phenylalanine--tRNA ligase subunit alpha [Candidatus Saccharibacteria bacterium]|nr:phenylalanine--tRNA ligase subunit alpha [Candidatus Saccharibacteria bacterium]